MLKRLPLKYLICGLPRSQGLRRLNLQEYQSKYLMTKFDIEVQKFRVASSVEEAEQISRNFKCDEYVVKAQILAGGRGKGTFTNGFKGGVHLTKNANDVVKLVGNMLNERLMTKQTKKEGVLVTKVMVAEALDIVRETYLALVMDRASGGPVVVCSPRGGVDIEEVAATDPRAIFKEPLDINKEVTREQGERVAAHLLFKDKAQVDSVVAQLQGLYRLFLHYDCTQIEVNPLGVTPSGRVVCFDAKLNFDDNAAFRQQAVFGLADPDAEETGPLEREAAQAGLSYVGLEGDIGCMVNGAGLAMATMDIVKLHGGRPANFLDLGGGVTVPQVEAAVRILAADPQVRVVLVNIFGGIVNCATVASGLVGALRKGGPSVPLVVRLEGTNVEEARTILAGSGLRMTACGDLDDAARTAVHALS